MVGFDCSGGVASDAAETATPEGAVSDAPRLHINRPSSVRFVCRVREAGRRRWQLLPGESRRIEQAIEQLARVFSTGNYKRGEVIMTADYYEPSVVIKMVQT